VIAVARLDQLENFLDVILEMAKRRVELVVDVLEKAIVFADLGTDVDAEGLESAHFRPQFGFGL
jgi:hypothetical protein